MFCILNGEPNLVVVHLFCADMYFFSIGERIYGVEYATDDHIQSTYGYALYQRNGFDGSIKAFWYVGGKTLYCNCWQF